MPGGSQQGTLVLAIVVLRAVVAVLGGSPWNIVQSLVMSLTSASLPIRWTWGVTTGVNEQSEESKRVGGWENRHEPLELGLVSQAARKREVVLLLEGVTVVA
jgi:hypothetical protein